MPPTPRCEHRRRIAVGNRRIRPAVRLSTKWLRTSAIRHADSRTDRLPPRDVRRGRSFPIPSEPQDCTGRSPTTRANPRMRTGGCAADALSPVLQDPDGVASGPILYRAPRADAMKETRKATERGRDLTQAGFLTLSQMFASAQKRTKAKLVSLPQGSQTVLSPLLNAPGQLPIEVESARG
jgi:hypothetical protein